MLLEGEQILASVKLLLIGWICEVLRAVSIFFLNKEARIKADIYVEENDTIDMRTAPASVKYNIIHDQSVLDMRWDLCSSCEFLTDTMTCSKCSCPMLGKYKLAHSSCPIGKWGKYTEKAKHGSLVTS